MTTGTHIPWKNNAKKILVVWKKVVSLHSLSTEERPPAGDIEEARGH